jgi:hypothetical protein
VPTAAKHLEASFSIIAEHLKVGYAFARLGSATLSIWLVSGLEGYATEICDSRRVALVWRAGSLVIAGTRASSKARFTGWFM